MILKVEDKAFKTHKAILCASSSVFTAMFESGMEECATNTIHISDIESETLSKLLEYIYTNHLEQWDIDMTKKLYSAADKYALQNLKTECQCYLSNNLNANNLCDILCLADLHHDSKLKNSAVNFLHMLKHDIIQSKEWKELTKKNVLLANEILMALCLK